MLFIDYKSAFNTIVPSKPITKLRTLGLNTSLYNCFLNFLTGLPQAVRVGSVKLTISTGAPLGCLDYSVWTTGNEGVSTSPSTSMGL